MRIRLMLFLILALVAVCLFSAAVYNLPPVHEHLAWRLETLRTKVQYAIRPPQQAVFVPQQQQVEAIVSATMQAFLATPSARPSPTPAPTMVSLGPNASLPSTAIPQLTATQQPTPTPQPTATPTASPTPLPGAVSLKGTVHEYQQMNNCGPATLAMALSFWGWQGDQTDTRAVLRPNFKQVDDKNVMPSEMVSYVENYTGLKALVRVGGDLEMLKRLVAGGFPVIIEKGFQPPKEDWMGHFELVTGYSDTRQRLITQDAYIMPDFPVPYDEITQDWWRDFNYVYVVIYPPEREAEILSILGAQADVTANYQYAAQKARDEIPTLSGRALYFAWYDLGSNLVALQDFAGAADAYDQAFAIYPTISEKDRPWRTLWYQVGPYEAYYQTGRYQDVLNLASTTLAPLSKPVLEETYYWAGKAREALGEMDKAVTDYEIAVDINPDSTPAEQELQRLGIQYP